jgi:pimeloyl-ACP methyl ester carboxylesterase
MTACGTETPPEIDAPPASVSKWCGVSGDFEWVTIETSDGTQLIGALSGSGPTGVLLAHQFPADLCQWAEFAPGLARRGFTTLSISFRCMGRSECPDDPASRRIDLDVAAGVGALRREGVEAVVIVGGSAGGTAALVSAAQIEPPVDAVVTLSAERDLGAVPAGYLTLDAGPAVRMLRSPVLFVVARADRYVSPQASRRMYEGAPSGSRLVVLPKFYGHGIDMLEGSWESRVGGLVVAFLKEHSA